MDTALTVMAVFAVVALAAAGAAAFYSWSRRNRTFERPVRRAGTVVERPGEPVGPRRASGRTVEEEHYSRTVQERGAPPRAYAGEGSLDDDARRPPM